MGGCYSVTARATGDCDAVTTPHSLSSNGFPSKQLLPPSSPTLARPAFSSARVKLQFLSLPKKPVLLVKNRLFYFQGHPRGLPSACTNRSHDAHLAEGLPPRCTSSCLAATAGPPHDKSGSNSRASPAETRDVLRDVRPRNTGRAGPRSDRSCEASEGRYARGRSCGFASSLTLTAEASAAWGPTTARPHVLVRTVAPRSRAPAGAGPTPRSAGFLAAQAPSSPAKPGWGPGGTAAGAGLLDRLTPQGLEDRAGPGQPSGRWGQRPWDARD